MRLRSNSSWIQMGPYWNTVVVISQIIDRKQTLRRLWELRNARAPDHWVPGFQLSVHPFAEFILRLSVQNRRQQILPWRQSVDTSRDHCKCQKKLSLVKLRCGKRIFGWEEERIIDYFTKFVLRRWRLRNPPAPFWLLLLLLGVYSVSKAFQVPSCVHCR